ncbi:MAG: cation diffusion facilitator family transporter [Sphaerochaetaceae bacterium]|nr:cation diffusion facilitator family transporter [Sphaerochaetaceae bacterium]
MKNKLSRDKQIIKTSVIGIISNILLSAFKLIIGLLSSSIAIMMDAINNLSDALSSIITIIGMKLALKPADNKHPLGHGRIEYLSALIVSSLVFFAGATSLIESVKKIFNPTTSNYTFLMVLFIIIAIFVKLILGKYTKKVGESVNSTALIASGSDATFDALVSASTLVSALIAIIWDINIDGYIGVAISLVIIKAGWDMLSDTLDRILGTRIDSKLSKEIKAKIKDEDMVIGVYDLILHNYGPETMIGSVHIELDEKITTKEIYELTRKLRMDMFDQYGIILTFGIYAANSEDPKVKEIMEMINTYILKIDGIIQMHAFYINFEAKQLSFDIVVDFNIEDKFALRDSIKDHLQQIYPTFDIFIAVDTYFSD